MPAVDPYRQASAAQSALNFGLVKVPFQAEVKEINRQFLDLLEANPNATVGELKQQLQSQIQGANRQLSLLNKIDLGSAVSLALGFVGLLGTVVTKDVYLPSLFAMMGGSIGLLGTVPGQKSSEAQVKGAETSIRRVDEWVDALGQPALKGAPLDQLVAATLEESMTRPQQ